MVCKVVRFEVNCELRSMEMHIRKKESAYTRTRLVTYMQTPYGVKRCLGRLDFTPPVYFAYITDFQHFAAVFVSSTAAESKG